MNGMVFCTGKVQRGGAGNSKNRERVDQPPLRNAGRNACREFCRSFPVAVTRGKLQNTIKCGNIFLVDCKRRFKRLDRLIRTLELAEDTAAPTMCVGLGGVYR